MIYIIHAGEQSGGLEHVHTANHVRRAELTDKLDNQRLVAPEGQLFRATNFARKHVVRAGESTVDSDDTGRHVLEMRG